MPRLSAGLQERAQRAAQAARAHAEDVDVTSRFPHEALQALRDERLLSLLIAPDEGGDGLGFAAVGAVTEILAAACGSTGLIFAMHHNQLAGLVRHADTPFFADRRREIADRQLLIASATTEKGIGGDVRRSTCCVEPAEDGTFVLVKDAPVVSYADAADVILITARTHPDAEPNDQVLVYADKTAAGLTLEQTSEWNTLGFRGTCSPGFILRASGKTEALVPLPFAELSARCMLPASHIFWSHVWVGIATEAAQRTRQHVLQVARRNPGVTPPAATGLAQLQARLQAFASAVHHAADRFDELTADDPELDSVQFALAMNGLKVTSSTAVVEIVSQALLIAGIAGYRQDSPTSLGRMLRDAHGAAIMVHNDRIIGNSSVLELMRKQGGSW